MHVRRTIPLVVFTLLAIACIPLQFPNLLPSAESLSLIRIPVFVLDLSAIPDIGVAILVYMAILAVGALVVPASKTDGFSHTERFLIYLLAGFPALALATFGLALIGLLHPLLWILPGGIILARVKRLLECLKGMGTELFTYGKEEYAYFGRGIWWTMLILLAATFLPHALSNTYPTTETDAINYHLYPARVYAELHRWVSLPDNPNFWPENMEMLYSLAFLLRSQVGAQLVHALSFPLIGLVIVAFTRRFNLPPVGMPAMLLLISMPVVSFVVGDSTSNDVPLALFVMLSLFMLFLWRERRTNLLLALAAVGLGTALGMKHLALLTVPFFLVFFPLVLRGEGKGRFAWFKPMLLFFSPALLVALPWYLKSLVQTGNPIWPMFSRFLPGIHNEFGAILYEVTRQSFGLWDPSEWYRIPFLMSFGDGIKLDGTLGPIPLFLTIVLLWVRPKGRVVQPLVLFCALSFLTWLVVVQEVRYLVFLVIPLLLLGLPATLDLFRGAGGPFPRVFGVVAVLFVLLSLPYCYNAMDPIQRYPALLPRRYPLTPLLNHSALPLSLRAQYDRNEYLDQTLPSHRTVAWANEHLPDSSKIFYMGADPPYLYLRKPMVWNQRSSSLRDHKIARTPDEWLFVLKREQVTHIMVRRSAFRYHWLADLESKWRYRHMRLVQTYNDFSLYEIRPEPRIAGDRPVLFALQQVRPEQGGFSTLGTVMHDFEATVLRESRNSLVLIGRSSIAWPIFPMGDCVLSFGLAKLHPMIGDGGIVRVRVRQGSVDTLLFSRRLDPASNPADRKWLDVSIDLSAFTQEGCTLIFESDAGEAGDYSADWFAFSEPLIIRKGASLYE